MRRLRVFEHISMDGVIENSPSEGGDFPYGDWTAPYRSPEGLRLVTAMYGESFDLLLGRRTYDLLGSYWSKAPKSPMADRLNAATKYVVTHRPESLEWGPAKVVFTPWEMEDPPGSPKIGRDLVNAIRALKAMRGPDLILTGSSSLTSALLDHGLADEVILLVNPVLLGRGKRFFSRGTPHRALALQNSQGLPSGIVVNEYKLIATMAEEAASRAKLEREIEIAREVQQRLFPQKFPEVAGIEMAAHCRPAQAVGGDYYDLIAIRGDSDVREGQESARTGLRGCDRLGIAIGDVSGKGISAALLMASLRASLRSQTLDGVGRDLGVKMANVNTLLYEASDINRYATFFFAELDCGSRRLHYVNAGHNAPALLRKEEGAWRVFRLEDGGPVVGLLPGAAYEEQTLDLLPGDILVAFTDGISEAMNAAEDEWGEDRMIAEATARADLNAAELLHRLFHAADAFAAGAPQHDDMTMLVLRISDA
jgi:serine phosphatase RsbU (regulator of sigma subunit)